MTSKARPDSLSFSGEDLKLAVATAQQGASDHSTCSHCGRGIFLAPFFLDGKLPNPPVWQHDSGTRTCRTSPKDWPHDSWPTATPRQETLPAVADPSHKSGATP